MCICAEMLFAFVPGDVNTFVETCVPVCKLYSSVCFCFLCACVDVCVQELRP